MTCLLLMCSVSVTYDLSVVDVFCEIVTYDMSDVDVFCECVTYIIHSNI